MSRFSDRYGYTKTEKAFQRESIDEPLRIALWNVLTVRIWGNYKPHDVAFAQHTNEIDRLIYRLWYYYFNNDMDTQPLFRDSQSGKGSLSFLKNYFFSCEWYEVYNFLEELIQDDSFLFEKEEKIWVNRQLERYNAAYRFVEKQIVEITSSDEIAAIESALTSSPDAVRNHLESALKMLSDTENKDYRNSVKESISAVEAVARIFTGKKNATLGSALKKIDRCHPALAQGFQCIYGYTSDEFGIRHALMDKPETTYSEAKFMLVACSAFASYLAAQNEII